MQHASAMVTALFLNASGWEVLRDGRFLRLPHTVLEVAKECSGTGQLTALIAFAIPLGVLMHKSIWPRLLLVLATFPLALLTNVIRIVLIALWNYNGLKSAIHGPYEILRIPFIYPLALVLLLLFSMFLGKLKRNKNESSVQIASIKKQTSRPVSIGLAWYIGCLMMLITISVIFFFHVRPVHYMHSITEFPLRANSWTGEDITDSAITFYMGKPDATLQRRYINDNGAVVTIFIARFDRQNTRKRISSIESDIFEKESKPVDIPVTHSATIHARLTESFLNNRMVVTVSWFDVDGSTCFDKNEVRKKIIANTLKNKHNNAAFIALSTCNSDAGEPGLLPLAVATFFPSIKTLLETNHARQ
jgi:EpsI family protein